MEFEGKQSKKFEFETKAETEIVAEFEFVLDTNCKKIESVLEELLSFEKFEHFGMPVVSEKYFEKLVEPEKLVEFVLLNLFEYLMKYFVDLVRFDHWLFVVVGLGMN